MPGAALTAKVKSFFTGDDVDLGEAYRDFRDASRYKVDRFSKENPGTALAAEVAGSLLTGGVGAARTGAIKAGDTLLKNAGRVAGTGAAFGGVTGAGVSEAETIEGVIDDVKFGTVLGAGTALLPQGLVTGGKKAVQKLTSANTSKVYQSSVDDLQEAGVNLTTGQRLGSDSVKATETTLADTMLGGAIADTLERQHARVQSKLMEKAGFSIDDVQDGLITNEAIKRAKENFSNRYGEVFGDQMVKIKSNKLREKLRMVESEHNAYIGPFQKRQISRIIEEFADDSFEMTGKAYQRNRSKLGRLASKNNEFSDLYKDLQRVLDDAFVDAADARTGAAAKQLRAEYTNFKNIEKAWKGNSGPTASEGYLPMGRLAKESKLSAANSGPTSDFAKLANSAQMVLKDARPNSGTASRALNAGVLTGGLGLGYISPTAATMSALGTLGGSKMLSRGLLGEAAKNQTDGSAEKLLRSGLIGTPVITQGLLATGN